MARAAIKQGQGSGQERTNDTAFSETFTGRTNAGQTMTKQSPSSSGETMHNGPSATEPSLTKWQRGESKGLTDRRLARGLGWFSIGLGLAEIAAPRGLAKMIGLRGNHDTLLRLLGAREIASGIGILAQRKPTGWLWSRVGGDAMDLALLGTAFSLPKANRNRLAAATAAVAGVTALDIVCSQQMSQTNGMTSIGGIRVTKAVTINRSPEELYRFWRDFNNLPQFMNHLESVQVTDNNRSHWTVKAPAGTTVEWDAQIIEDQPNELISWHSVEGAQVENAGSVRFERAPAGRGTIVKVQLQYRPPAGVIGAAVAKLFGEDPEWQVKDDLRRFKQLMETGDIITTEGQSAGRSSSTSWRYDGAVRS
ncbi:MAG TPA: SRPBCC family protein [Blastocatellia bacterium]|nr:SRPBCC family protein [Blastocatellia bacterium]HMX24119.1 SRPBCC family protein [Blastocatellia bacterium]HMY70531.1 SRPBCC family protein [Blastocatellia bacterium]HMZ17164.1 SRPBCC family protein [Blastocatellia bacterium]HNG30754.1 SRPBCC family protein [Blastocatellia bacterium]